MVNDRPKIKKTLKPCFSQASTEDSDHQSLESGALIGSNDDILTEILLRLPVTSILRFKSVSKHWHSLLSHSHLTQRYDNLSKSPGLFAYDKYLPFDVDNPTTPPFSSLDSYFDLPDVRIVQSCNGLLLCCTDRGPKGRKSALKYYVFNPTTKQLALIPPICGGLKVLKIIRFMGLAYHQTDCPHYKVVCVRCLEPVVALFQIQVYSSDTKKWEIFCESFCMGKPILFGPVYWNRAVYWAPFCGRLFYFKLDVEQLQMLPLPEGSVSSKIFIMYFGESRGHLHLVVQKNREDDCLCLNVYEMLSDHSGWFVKYQLQLDELLGSFPEMISEYPCYFTVVDVVRGEKEEDTFIVLDTSEKIITYNVYEKSFKQFISVFERSRKYYVFNPTTKQFAIVPSVTGGQNVRKTIPFMGLAFHQTDCLPYKVVCIRSVERYRELFQIHIYSSYTGKWKISSESFSADYFTPFWYGVYWNGAIHWAPSCRNPLYFKIEDEQLQTLPLPANLASSKGYYDGAMPMYFGESRGHLHLVDTAIGENHLHLNVYEMLNDHSGWFVKYQVELDELTGAFPEMNDSNQPPSSHCYYDFEVFDVVRGEKEEDAFMVVSIRGKVIRFNVHDKSFKQISDLTNDIYGRIGGLHVHRYTETLASFL
ncbi:putative F-box domain-containing protein [Helianthus annuus]|nr:putative F-box domain-containing protein [Helianthus annuus]